MRENERCKFVFAMHFFCIVFLPSTKFSSPPASRITFRHGENFLGHFAEKMHGVEPRINNAR